MGRPDIQGTVIDDAAAPAAGGKNNGTQDAINAEDNDALNEQGDDTNLDRGTADLEAGEDAGGEEEALPDETGNPKPGSTGPLSTEEVREQLRHELREEMRKEMAEQMRANQPPAPEKQISEEEWTQHESDWGIPRSAIKNTVERMTRVHDTIMKKIDERFAKFEKAESLRSLSRDPGFTDANRYSKDIDEFLSHYPAQHHSNPDLLKRAVIYSRGKNMKTQVAKARNGSERNLRIAAPGGRPAAGGAPIRTGSKIALTASQRSAARAFGMTDEEYVSSGKRKQLT